MDGLRQVVKCSQPSSHAVRHRWHHPDPSKPNPNPNRNSAHLSTFHFHFVLRACHLLAISLFISVFHGMYIYTIFEHSDGRTGAQKATLASSLVRQYPCNCPGPGTQFLLFVFVTNCQHFVAVIRGMHQVNKFPTPSRYTLRCELYTVRKSNSSTIGCCSAHEMFFPINKS